MSRKSQMIEHSQMWSIPFDFKGQCGVLVAKLGSDRVALHTLNGWNVMSMDCWNRRFVTPFPLMCPWSEGSPGWCIVSEVITSTGHRLIYAITTEVMEYALHEHVADLRLAGFKVATLREAIQVDEPEPEFFGIPDRSKLTTEPPLYEGGRRVVKLLSQ